MIKKMSLFERVLAKPVTLVAIVKGKPNPRLATVEAKPEDWHGGHPIGAVLMKPVDLDCTRIKQPIVIEGWQLREGTAVLGEEMLVTPIRLEPEVTMRLDRCAVVRRP
jgi:hypothetical protein